MRGGRSGRLFFLVPTLLLGVASLACSGGADRRGDHTAAGGGPPSGATGGTVSPTGGAVGPGEATGGAVSPGAATGGASDPGRATGGAAGEDATAGAGMTGGVAGAMESGSAGGGAPPVKVLVWNNAVTYGTGARTKAIPVLKRREATDGLSFDTTFAHTIYLGDGPSDTQADASVFTDAGLAPYDVVLFLNPSGATLHTSDGMESVHRQALEDFLSKRGRGLVGTITAADTYHTGWPAYADLLGAQMKSITFVPTAGTVTFVPGVDHPILRAANVPSSWVHEKDGWYIFEQDLLSAAPEGFQVLLEVGLPSKGTLPCAWTHDLPPAPGALQGGRVFYAGFGFSSGGFEDDHVVDLVVAGLKWAAHRL